MDDAGDVVERVATHRKPAVVCRRHLRDDLRETLGHADGNDVGARDHHVGRVQILKAEDVAKKRLFMRIKARPVRFRNGKQVFQLVTARRGLL